MKAGFTGTREGMTLPQRAAFLDWVEDRGLTAFHQGCCIGADAQATAIIWGVYPRPYIVGHPPDNTALMAFDHFLVCNKLVPPLPYLQRNAEIVAACEVLLAAPKGPENMRSGTWATIRYARRHEKPIVIFWPDGTITDEIPIV